MKVHEEFVTEDYNVDQGWLRVFCAPLPDESCGFLLFQHHFTKVNDVFDHKTEANIGLITGPSYQTALNRISLGGDYAPQPEAYRRIARLLKNGSLEDSLLDTLSERGLLRCVAYTDEQPEEKRLALVERAGWREETRDGKLVYVLDLDV